MNDFDKFLLWEQTTRDTVDFKKIYVDMAGDLVAGIMLSQIVFWHLPDRNDKTRLKIEKDGHFWIAKAYSDWYEEVRITEWQAPRALAILVEKGIVEKKIFKFDGAPTVHIRLIENQFLELFSALVHSQNGGDDDTKTGGSPKWKRGNHSNGNEGITRMEMREKPISLTEITTETTTEINFPPPLRTREEALPSPKSGECENHCENHDELIGSVFKAYESEIGALTPMIAEQITDGLGSYPPNWFSAAIQEAAENNKRSWRYVEAILQRWKKDGFQVDRREKLQRGVRRTTTKQDCDRRALFRQAAREFK